MKIVGLTGGIGSGKSVILEVFSSYGVPCYQSDNRAKELMQKSPELIRQIKVLFAHPQSAGHGLTLTKANTIIWCSPTYNAEHFQQFNRRIHRSGQTQKTETILISARGTWESEVYNKLNGKLNRMESLLNVLSELHKV